LDNPKKIETAGNKAPREAKLARQAEARANAPIVDRMHDRAPTIVEHMDAPRASVIEHTNAARAHPIVDHTDEHRAHIGERIEQPVIQMEQSITSEKWDL
jgi:hypothetical protein